MKPFLSVIIPAFNEAKRIKATLLDVGGYLELQPYTYEIIVVDDGSEDTTASLTKDLATSIPNTTLLRMPANQGKGAAVRAGMISSRGELRLFMDADGSTNIREIEKLLPFTHQGYDVIIGSRRIHGALIKVKQSLIRDFLGGVFRTLVHALTPVDVYDTQNGFKLFTQKAAEEIFFLTRVNGWSFDIEALLLAKKLGFKIKEVPIIWANSDDSKVRYRHMLRMFFDLLSIRFSHYKTK